MFFQSSPPNLLAHRTSIAAHAAAAALVALLTAGCAADTPGDRATGDAAATEELRWTGPAPDGDRTGAVAYPSSPEEPRLGNLRQLTRGGTNAEAYFSADGSQLVFQATWPDVHPCDQIYSMNVDGTGLQRISLGEGRTTCGYFFPDMSRLLFSSTHAQGADCPTPPDRSQGYVWGLFEYDIYTRDLRTGEVRPLTVAPGYDAEATISPDGSKIVFTSMRGGDLDLWVMDADGSNLRQLTDREGYEGGAFFSPDGSRIVFRAFYPETEEERQDYRRLLEQGLVRGGRLEIYVMNADGSNVRQVTDNGASNFAPFFHPNGRQIIFSSNLQSPGGRNFNLYLINDDGTGLERVTSGDQFDSFPMFSPDGRYLAFASSRGAASPGEINVFLAEWNDAAGGAGVGSTTAGTAPGSAP